MTGPAANSPLMILEEDIDGTSAAGKLHWRGTDAADAVPQVRFTSRRGSRNPHLVPTLGVAATRKVALHHRRLLHVSPRWKHWSPKGFARSESNVECAGAEREFHFRYAEGQSIAVSMGVQCLAVDRSYGTGD